MIQKISRSSPSAPRRSCSASGRGGFWWFFVPALAGFWLVNQAHPFDPSAKGIVVILEATAAAALWGARDGARPLYVPRARFQHVLSLRFFFGCSRARSRWGSCARPRTRTATTASLILYLALVTGLLALTLYYYGLQRTPAVLSSLAELTYPAVAVIAGIYAYGQHLTWTQWLGIALILGSVTLLPLRRRRVVAEPQPRELISAPAPAPG